MYSNIHHMWTDGGGENNEGAGEKGAGLGSSDFKQLFGKGLTGGGGGAR